MRPELITAILILILLTGCAVREPCEIDYTICRELDRELPTYSPYDTLSSLRKGAEFHEVYSEVCPEGEY